MEKNEDVHETEAARSLHCVSNNMMAGDFTHLRKYIVQGFVRNVIIYVLDIKVGIGNNRRISVLKCYLPRFESSLEHSLVRRLIVSSREVLNFFLILTPQLVIIVLKSLGLAVLMDFVL